MFIKHFLKFNPHTYWLQMTERERERERERRYTKVGKVWHFCHLLFQNVSCQ